MRVACQRNRHPAAQRALEREMGILTRSGRSLSAAAGSFLDVLRRQV
ncbi:hypothetical protein [Pigmentiphaga sp. NML080357]|nr:hypothetical protein [Pigmentiphaga sp. NML080357]